MIAIKTLSHTNTQTILDCFNVSFSDYSIPLQLSLEQLENKINSDNINKDISVGAFKDQKLIGFILHGDRVLNNRRVAYNGGTGVIPNERGNRMTKKMYDFIKPILKTKAIEEVILEVISDNRPAITSYKNIGFTKTRELICYSGDPVIKVINKEVIIKKVDHSILGELDLFGEVVPSWQNAIESIRNIGSNAIILLATIGNEICGYVILNKLNHRILQIAVKKEKRNQLIGSTLLNYIKEHISKTTSIINVDRSSLSTLHFFESRNFNETVSQIEMKLNITSR